MGYSWFVGTRGALRVRENGILLVGVYQECMGRKLQFAMGSSRTRYIFEGFRKAVKDDLGHVGKVGTQEWGPGRGEYRGESGVGSPLGLATRGFGTP